MILTNWFIISGWCLRRISFVFYLFEYGMNQEKAAGNSCTLSVCWVPYKVFFLVTIVVRITAAIYLA